MISIAPVHGSQAGLISKTLRHWIHFRTRRSAVATLQRVATPRDAVGRTVLKVAAYADRSRLTGTGLRPGDEASRGRAVFRSFWGGDFRTFLPSIAIRNLGSFGKIDPLCPNPTEVDAL